MYCIITFYCLLPSFVQIHNSDLCFFIYYYYFLFILYQAKSHTTDVLILNRYCYCYYYYYYYYYYYAFYRLFHPSKEQQFGKIEIFNTLSSEKAGGTYY